MYISFFCILFCFWLNIFRPGWQTVELADAIKSASPWCWSGVTRAVVLELDWRRQLSLEFRYIFAFLMYHVAVFALNVP